MSITYTAAEFKENWPENILQQLTDDEGNDSVVDSRITIEISMAKLTLGNWIDIDDSDVITTYTEERIKAWLSLLTYYHLFSRGEREHVAQDKYNMVEKAIAIFQKNRSINEADVEDVFITSDAIIEEEDILDWK